MRNEYKLLINEQTTQRALGTMNDLGSVAALICSRLLLASVVWRSVQRSRLCVASQLLSHKQQSWKPNGIKPSE